MIKDKWQQQIDPANNKHEAAQHDEPPLFTLVEGEKRLDAVSNVACHNPGMYKKSINSNQEKPGQSVKTLSEKSSIRGFYSSSLSEKESGSVFFLVVSTL